MSTSKWTYLRYTDMRPDKPLISFIIPAYNIEGYIEECVDSILAQARNDCEIIVVDDGSTDRTSVTIDSLAADNRCVTVIHTHNGGVSRARNTGLDHANGEWIWFVDGDDKIMPGAIDAIRPLTENADTDIIFHGLIEGISETDYRQIHTGSQAECVDSATFLEDHFAFQNGMVLFRRSVIENCRLRFTPGMKMAEDLEFQYLTLLHARKCSSLDNAYYLYRTRPGSAIDSPQSVMLRINGGIDALSRILAYTESSDTGIPRWLYTRLRLLIKSSINASMAGNAGDRRSLRKRIQSVINAHSGKIDRKALTDFSIRLFLLSPRTFRIARKIR